MLTTETESAPSRDSSLDQWLDWLAALHPSAIDLGLERVAAVASRAGLLRSAETAFPVVITIGGTNGKGSVVAMLSAIYHAAGYRVGSYTSPHINQFNERICIDLEPASSARIVEGLVQVEAHRDDTSLTYFEFTTLAAMRVFLQAQVDIVILEVGLGGRLDAVNIWDTDCAVLVSIDLDHQAWLGYTREDIAGEKVAIARSGKPLVVAERDLPAAVQGYVQEHDVELLHCGDHYRFESLTGGWQFDNGDWKLVLPEPGLAGPHQIANAAAAVAAVHALLARLPVDQAIIGQGLQQASVPGRFEISTFHGNSLVLDVAHNPASAAALAAALAPLLSQTMPGKSPGLQIIIAMMADKDTESVIRALLPFRPVWHCITLTEPRALAAADLAGQIRTLSETAEVHVYAGADDGQCEALCAAVTGREDILLVTGSFFTVSALSSRTSSCRC